jgi:two-component system, response regulator PdtaR
VRVLIAEDDPVIGLGLAKRLRGLGHEPLGPAPDGRAAVELAVAEDPDVCVFDIDMPRLDGLGAARELAERGLRKPVVVITGVDDPGLVERSVDAGVYAYLTKPVDDRELEAAIQLAAGRHREREDAVTALEERKLVERAKAVLIEGLGLSEPEAFRRLQKTARDRNLRMADVASQLLEQAALLRKDD